MKDRVIFVKEAKWKSIVLRDNELWISEAEIKNLATFEEAISTPHKAKVVFYNHPLEKLRKLKFNESSDTVAYEYLMKTKNKIIKLKFNDTQEANEFGNYLGEQLQFEKHESAESKLKPLLFNSLCVLLGLLGTYVMGFYFNEGDFDSTSGTRRSRSGGAMIRLIYDTIGQTGVLIVGALITSYLIYQLYQRYQNPAKDIMFTKKKSVLQDTVLAAH